MVFRDKNEVKFVTRTVNGLKHLAERTAGTMDEMIIVVM